MKRPPVPLFLLVISLFLVSTSCASLRSASRSGANYVGDWEYKILEIPVDIDGTLVISYEEGVFGGTMVTPMGNLDLTELTIEAGVLKASFDAEGNYGELDGTFEGNSYKGIFFIADTEFPMTMERK